MAAMTRVRETSPLLPGDPEEIDGYLLMGRLGEGGQGVVFLATAPSGERVAIKQLRPGLVGDEPARAALAKEVAAARLVAPFCTARVIDARLDGPWPHVVSEYIDGPTLQQHVLEDGPVTGASLDRLAIGTITALAAIHQAGVIHRDVKPGNVMLASDGPRMIDFGIARDFDADTTGTSRVFGTPAYMAPEQLNGGRAGTASDVFAWASTMAYAATGHSPFEASNVMAVVQRITSGRPDLDGVPENFGGVLRRCLVRDPRRRPSAEQILLLLLGQPERDVSDPAEVFAQATRIADSHEPAPSFGGGPVTQVVPPAPEPTQHIPSFATGPASGSFATGPASGSIGLAAPARPASKRPMGAPGGPGKRPNRSPVYDPPPPSGRGSKFPLVAGLLVSAIVAGAIALATGDWFWRGDPASGASANQVTPPTQTAEPDGRPSEAADEAADEEEPAAKPSPTGDDDRNRGNNNDDEDRNGDNGRIVPAAFDGTWEGQGSQPGANFDEWTVEMDLEEGEADGTFEIPTLNCKGTLTVLQASQEQLLLREQVTDDPRDVCADSGRFRLSVSGSEELTFTWEDDANARNRADGSLTRQ
jgi:serine/threonine protein kinase